MKKVRSRVTMSPYVIAQAVLFALASVKETFSTVRGTDYSSSKRSR